MLSGLLLALLTLQSSGPGTISIPGPTPEKAVRGWESEPVLVGKTWNEAIVSVNLKGGTGDVHIQAAPVGAESTSKWLDLGTIARGREVASFSVKNQRLLSNTRPPKEVFSVATDTLRSSTSGALVLRIQSSSLDCVVAKVYVTYSDATQSVLDAGPHGTYPSTLAVPQICQGDFPNGEVLCSPTALAMVLGYYADLLHRPEYRASVPEITKFVWDKVYDGAGNWAFNVAYAGSLPGLKAHVARLGTLQELENYVASGTPVVCSVSRLMLNGKPLTKEGKGHLIVVRGFAANGDLQVNDPGKRMVAQTYPRSDFLKAWNYSHGTCYIIEPD